MYHPTNGHDIDEGMTPVPSEVTQKSSPGTWQGVASLALVLGFIIGLVLIFHG